MGNLTLSPIIYPQWITGGITVVAGVITAETASFFEFAPAGSSAVPAGVNYLIQGMRLANTSGVSVTVAIWRQNIGAGAFAGANENLVVPAIVIPPNSFAYPFFDVTTLWGAILQPGDQLYAGATAANVLTAAADGAIITL